MAADHEPLDPLDELNELVSDWRALAPPEPTASVDALDAATRATIDWLKAAWRAGAPTRVALPWRVRARLLRPRVRPWLAAAAALLLFALVYESERGRAIPTVDPTTNLTTATAPVAAVETLSCAPDRMELRSGSVRLILLTPSPESNR